MGFGEAGRVGAVDWVVGGVVVGVGFDGRAWPSVEGIVRGEPSQVWGVVACSEVDVVAEGEFASVSERDGVGIGRRGAVWAVTWTLSGLTFSGR